MEGFAAVKIKYFKLIAASVVRVYVPGLFCAVRRVSSEAGAHFTLVNGYPIEIVGQRCVFSCIVL